jgi:hypothetical protein
MAYRSMKFEQTASFNYNQERAGDLPTCARCGRGLVNPAGSVHVIDGGGVVLHPEDEKLYNDQASDLGFWSVGSECAKAFKGFIYREQK